MMVYNITNRRATDKETHFRRRLRTKRPLKKTSNKKKNKTVCAFWFLCDIKLKIIL